MKILLTEEWKDITTASGLTSGSFKAWSGLDRLEIAVGDVAPAKNEGILYDGGETGNRNFDTGGKKLWARSIRGNAYLLVVPGFF